MMRLLLRQFGPVCLLVLAFAGIFLAVFALYGLPLEPILYAAGLCLLLGGTALSVGLARYLRRHRRRKSLLSEEELSEERLVPPSTLIEADDHAVMALLCQRLHLAQSQLLRERTETLSYFSAWVHQAKTPLSVLRLTLQTVDSPENRAMRNELTHIEQYVDMALCYARLSNPTKDLVLRMQPIDPVIRAAIRTYAPLLIQKRLTMQYAGCTDQALTDERWLRFLLEQVLSNAVKYTATGGVEIDVLPGPRVRLRDTGMGIAPEDIPRVFDKGYTGYNGRMGEKSTGIGLYLCRETAQMLGHTISLTSEPGVGTEVTIDLHRQPLQVE